MPEQVLEEARILRETQERLDAVRAGRSDPLLLQAAVPADRSASSPNRVC